MAEHSAFQQRFGQHRAIDIQERPIAATAPAVDLPRHEFLARAALAQEQCGGVDVLRHQVYQMVQLLHFQGHADHGVVHALLVVNVLDPELACFDQPLHQIVELQEVHGLRKILISSELHRFHCVRDAAAARHDHNGCGRTLSLEVLQHIDAILVRQLHVQQNDVRGDLLGNGTCPRQHSLLPRKTSLVKESGGGRGRVSLLHHRLPGSCS